ncbi:MAG: capsular biosynthesis protein [Burkholderiales bacterium]|nr:capsular biosynthesis protein [Pseudomonadota bacterium]MCC7067056.1 capsular biosynthesis protein [Burkholderiales bacterium]
MYRQRASSVCCDVTARAFSTNVIDLHCHLLPGIDDGAKDLDESLQMARIAVADGIKTTFCTPHIYPGLFENTGPDIRQRVRSLQLILRDRGIELTLGVGADAHLVPEFVGGLACKRIPSLNDSQYVLVEPPHHVRPPRFVESVFEITAAGYVPIITHPERLTWAGQHFEDFLSIARSGGWLQVTGAALLGNFGKTAANLARKFVTEGWCDVLASDGHSASRRRPVLSEAFALAQTLLGGEEARRLVFDRPAAVLANATPASLIRPPAHALAHVGEQGKIRRFLGRVARVGR